MSHLERQKTERQKAEEKIAPAKKYDAHDEDILFVKSAPAMIVKKIKHANDPKPKEWQISDLVNYISDPDANKRGEKIEYAKGINFVCDELVSQKVEMIALARETVHSKMPVNHWIFHGRKESSQRMSKWTSL